MRSRMKPGGFFSDWRRVAAVAVAGGAVLAAALILLLRTTEPREPEEQVPNPVATITMRDGGQMRFELYPDQAPNTVNNFIYLAKQGFFDGRQFFRVIPGVLIQGGDPNDDGTGDPGYAIRGEFEENGFEGNTLSHLRGAISMARQSGYYSAGSQFFIMQGSYPEYNGRYAAFGKIAEEDTASLNVLDAIASQPTDSAYVPLTRQVISTVRVETFGHDYGEPETLEREQQAAS